MSPSSTVTLPQAFALALQHHQAGRLAEAETLYRQIVTLQPQHPAACSNLGEVYRAQGHFGEAIACYRRALQSQPQSPQVYNNLGLALSAQGHLNEGIAAYRQALQFKPDYAEAHNNLGNALHEQRKLDEAIAAFRRALHHQPGFAIAWNNLGIALAERGEVEEAIAAYQQALTLQPDYPQACNNLGSTLTDLGRLDEAMAVLQRALSLQPTYAEAHYNLGNALKARGQLDEAVAAYRRALEFRPDYAEFHNNLGNVLTEQGFLDEAIASYRQAIELKPEQAWLHSNLICTLNFHPNSDAKTIALEQQHWIQRFADPLNQFIRPHTNDRDPDRRLRIGYVSPDFRGHVVGMYLAPLFRCHDHQDFEVRCYSGVARPDSLTAEFRQNADHWRSTVGIADEALAEMIRQDRIDILVDLSLHTAGNRLPLFARQPAPVQVSFAGHPEGTDLDTIEYQISDHYLESEIGDGRSKIGHELRSPIFDLRSAKRVLLIDSYWCYDPCGIEAAVNALPALQNGHVTFGCLNNYGKVNEPVLKLWARILAQIENSRLVLLSRVGSHRQRALDILQREGIAADRMEFLPPRPRKEYLASYHGIDIALDPFPYNGHATSLEALWMGVPVVSLAGHRPVARAGLSQLSTLGLPELVAFSPDDYLAIATQLAHDLPRLAELRKSLRPRMQASPLMDAPRFARNIENAFRSMWRQWCAHPQPLTP